MDASTLRERARTEGGFTLIELLVVMIIIAILMAVAVPTFLSQKQNAVATKAKSNIKQLVNAIESCAASNVTGAYSEGGNNCLDKGRLTSVEPTLANLFTANGAETYNVTPVGQTGFTVQAIALGTDGGNVTFVETHAENGQITKTCGPAGQKACGGKTTW